MKIELIKPDEGKAYNITEACGSVTWQGSVMEAARTAGIDYINAPYDKKITVPPVVTGDFLALTETTEFFYGQFFSGEANGTTGTISYEARDIIKNMLESTGKYNFKNITPEAIAARVCADMQIPVGTMAATGINIKSMLCNGSTIYDIVMGAYTQARKVTRKRYQMGVAERKVNVLEQNIILGGGYYLGDDLNITDSSSKEDMNEIINLVRIYDSKGAQIGEAKDEASIKKYGVYQSTYEKEEGIDPVTAAKGMLRTLPEQTITVSGIGDINCISGRGVIVRDSATGLSGLYWIVSDKHTWSGEAHTMELELSFEKLMDEKEIEVEKEAAK